MTSPPRTGLRARLKLPLVIVVLLLVLGGGAFWRLRHPSKAAPAGPGRIMTAEVTTGDISRSVTALGKLSPMVVIEVGTQVSGLITEMNVDFNSPVKKGQVLARIDSSTFEQKLRQVEADLAATEAEYEQSKLETVRLKGLRDGELISQHEYDQQALSLKRAETAILRGRAAVEDARLDVQRCTITSPIDGVVIHKQADVGKTVAASLSTPTLCVIAQDLAKMQMTAGISEVDVTLVEAGQAVTFTVDAFPGKTFHGRIRQVRNPYTPVDGNNQPSPQGGQGAPPTTYSAIIEVDNAALLLRPGMTATVFIIVQHREKVAQLTNAALRVRPPAGLVITPAAVPAAPAAVPPDGISATVYRVPKGGKATAPEAVQVSLGLTDSFVTEILGGLQPGDTVITSFGQPADAAPGT